MVDCIYPPFRIFLKTIANPVDRHDKVFSKSQEAFRNGTERVYAVLFSRCHILANRSRIWTTSDMDLIICCCVTPHDMIVEARNSEDEDGFGIKNMSSIDEYAATVLIRMGVIQTYTHDYSDYLQAAADQVEDAGDHLQLQNALADTICERYGTESAPNYLLIETPTGGENEDGGDINGHGDSQGNFDKRSE